MFQDFRRQDHEIWKASIGRGILITPLMPLFPWFWKGHGVGRRWNALLMLRASYVAYLVAFAGLAWALGFIVPFWADPRPWVVALVLISAAYGYAGPRLLRAPEAAADVAPSQRYAISFFLRIAFSSAGILMGFVAAFVIDAWWIYLAALTIGLPGFLAAAPTRGSILESVASQPASGAGEALWEQLTSAPMSPNPVGSASDGVE